MVTKGKRYTEAAALVDKAKVYSLADAVSIMKKFPKAKFDEGVDIAIKLNLKTNQRIRGIVNFPNSTGRVRRVAVFAVGEKAEEAKQAGADIVGGDDLAEKIKNGFLDFDVCAATPDMMRTVGKLGKILGTRGMMPNPKTGTVSMDIATVVKELKAGKYEFKNERNGVVHLSVAKISQEPEAIVENAQALVRQVNTTRPSEVKGEYIKKVTISTTMGVGITIEPRSLIA